MKKIALVILFIFTLFYGFSQTYLNKVYPFNNSFHHSTSNLLYQNNEYLVFGDITDTSIFKDNPIILKIDSIGNIVYKKVFNIDSYRSYNSMFNYYDIKTNCSNFLYAGTKYDSIKGDAFLILYDSSINIIFEKNYVNQYQQCFFPLHTRQINDNGFILCGENEYNPAMIKFNSWILKTDSLGNEKWRKSYDFQIGKNSRLFTFAYNHDSTAYLYGGITYPEDIENYSDSYILKTDTSGNEIWKMNYGRSWYDSQLLIKNDPTNDSIIIGVQSFALGSINSGSAGPYGFYTPEGNLKFSKINSNTGVVIWDTVLDVQKYGIVPLRLLVQQNGDYLACGYYTPQNGPFLGWAAKMSKSGELKWFRAYNYTSSSSGGSQKLADIKETGDGGYVFVGTASITETNGHEKCWIVKTDSLGCVQPGCQTTEVYEPIILKKNNLKIYPNPAKSFFSVEYDLSNSELPLLLKITDAAGRNIEEKQLKNKRDIIAINCSQYAKGNYNCIIFEGQKLKQMAKFVVTH